VARGAEVGGMGWTCSLEKIIYDIIKGDIIIYDIIKGGIRRDRDNKHNPMGVVGHGHINLYLSHIRSGRSGEYPGFVGSNN